MKYNSLGAMVLAANIAACTTLSSNPQENQKSIATQLAKPENRIVSFQTDGIHRFAGYALNNGYVATVWHGFAEKGDIRVYGTNTTGYSTLSVENDLKKYAIKGTGTSSMLDERIFCSRKDADIAIVRLKNATMYPNISHSIIAPKKEMGIKIVRPYNYIKEGASYDIKVEFSNGHIMKNLEKNIALMGNGRQFEVYNFQSNIIGIKGHSGSPAFGLTNTNSETLAGLVSTIRGSETDARIAISDGTKIEELINICFPTSKKEILGTD